MSAPLASLKRPSRRKPLAACVAVAFALGGASVVHANTLFVSNCATSGVGSLPAAAAGAASGDTISISITDNSACSHNLQGVTEVMVLASNLTLGTGVTISGPGATTFGISGKQNYSVRSSGDLTVNNVAVMYGKYLSTVSGIAARGGCIYARNNLTLTGVTTYHCYAHNNATGGLAAGGAVAANNGGVTMTSTILTNSKASGNNAKGGAVYGWTGGVTMTNSIITATGSSTATGNKYGSTALSSGGATNYFAEGGAIWSDGSTTLNNTQVVHGKAYVNNTSGGKAAGGGIWSLGAVSIYGGSYVKSSYAKTVSASSAIGGGIYSSSNVTVGGIFGSTGTVESNFVYSKSGTALGGGVYSAGSSTADYAYITRNKASGSTSSGGGIYAKNGFNSKYGYFWDNRSANGSGGAVIVASGNTNARGMTVNANYASTKYGGLAHLGGGATTATITQSTISHNIAHNGAAAGLWMKAFTTKLYNNTIAYNPSYGSSAGPPVEFKYGNSGSTLGLYSNLMSGNTYGTTHDDINVINAGSNIVTVSGNHNLIRAPGAAVPGDTIVGKCPLLYPGRFLKLNYQYQYVIRHEVASPATNAGANPVNLSADQRGGSIFASSPPRVSGPPGGTAVADIGSYEVDQSDEIFDERFEGCLN